MGEIFRNEAAEPPSWGEANETAGGNANETAVRDPDEPADRTNPNRLAVRVRVPVVRANCENLEVVGPTMIQLLSALSRGWEPVQLRFVVCAGGGRPPSAEWQVDATDTQTAISAATTLATIANAVLADIRLGEPEEVTGNPAEPTGSGDPPEPPAIAVADFVASRRARVDYVRGVSSAWQAAREDSVRWQLTIDLDALLSPPAEEETGRADEKASYPEAPTPEAVAPGERLVGARIRLVSYGPSKASKAITTLFSEDSMGDYGLQSRPVAGPSAPLTWLPLDLAAHLLAAPARMPNAFRPAPLPPTTLFGLFEAAATPHVLIVGASGQGKTVFLSRLVHRACEIGEPPVVVDVHDGWLARRAMAFAREHGMRPVVADFSRSGKRAPHLRLASPPPGIDRRQWADELWDIVRHLIWAEMPVEYFGPVGERGVRALIKLAVLDPADATELADVPSLITDPSLRDLRRALLDRIGDADLTNAIEREIIPMINSRDPGNSATWLLSKLSPLFDTPALRSTPGRGDTLGVEQAVKAGRPFILYAPAATLGDSGSRLVVSLALHRLWLAARRRRTPAPTPVVVDEWQLYPSTTIAAMLSQGRKYGLRMRLANQNLAQLSTTLRDSVLGNSGSVVCFRVGPADAALLDGLFPTVPRWRLQTLPPHTLAVTFGDRDLVTAAPPPLPE